MKKLSFKVEFFYPLICWELLPIISLDTVSKSVLFGWLKVGIEISKVPKDKSLEYDNIPFDEDGDEISKEESRLPENVDNYLKDIYKKIDEE